MRLTGEDTVYLEQGEVIPFSCQCGYVFKPTGEKWDRTQRFADCPLCQTELDAEQSQVKLIEGDD